MTGYCIDIKPDTRKIIKNLLKSYFLTWHRSPHLWSHTDVVFSGWWWQPPERDRKEYYLWLETVIFTWLTQFVIVTLHVGHTSTLSLHLAQITWPFCNISLRNISINTPPLTWQQGTGGWRGMERHTGHMTDSCSSLKKLSASVLCCSSSCSLCTNLACDWWRLLIDHIQ